MMNVIMRSPYPESDGAQPALGTEIDWSPAEPPDGRDLCGEHVLLRRVRSGDEAALFEAGGDEAIWTYLPYGPYGSVTEMHERVARMQQSDDPLFYAICPLPEAKPQGVASYLRITPEHGTIEIGHIWFGTSLQRTTAATEAIFLLARHAFDELGYRRLEWKCNALNEKSRRAAERFGFTYEGVFRNHQVVKGRNRDTAWYAITGEDWPALRAGFERWLEPENFDAQDRQRSPLRVG
jgi:RimJ/RimL family protein N-acetyltransferase